jgi:protein-disulfide isomerase-like protein with CxxC motif
VSPQRYLADTVAAASGVDEFSAALAAAGPTATRARLRAVVTRLRAPLAQTRASAARLAGQRLEDARLEAQRARASAALDRVVAAMAAVVAAAEAGDPEAAEAASTAFGTAVGDLRSLPETP